jgi:hypothetical protein
LLPSVRACGERGDHDENCDECAAGHRASKRNEATINFRGM